MAWAPIIYWGLFAELDILMTISSDGGRVGFSCLLADLYGIGKDAVINELPSERNA